MLLYAGHVTDDGDGDVLLELLRLLKLLELEIRVNETEVLAAELIWREDLDIVLEQLGDEGAGDPEMKVEAERLELATIS